MELFGRKEIDGVHPPDDKISSEDEIEMLSNPDQVVLPLSQHIGAPAQPVVKVGDEVKAGQKIGESNGFVSSPVHATISGEIKEIRKVVDPNSSELSDAVVIESNGDDDLVKIGNPSSPEDLQKDEMLSRIREAGIVGLGGATFPTSVKLQPPEDQDINAIIVNGAECEPYITSDHRVMLEYSVELLKGLKVMMNILDCDRAYIAIENNKLDAIKKFRDIIPGFGFSGNVTVESLGNRYPLGSEKVLLKSVLGLEVPMGGLPLDVGVVVQNVSTVKAIHDAIYKAKPLIERVITVTGNVKEPKNLKTRFGTPAINLIERSGGTTGEAEKLIFGGPMMGTTQNSFKAPVQKGTNAVLIKEDSGKSEDNCIRCNRCVEVCPMDLVPLKFVSYVKNNKHEELENYYIESCIECGSCSYSCPANIPIVQYIRTGKNELNK